ncbi:hypothetical protein C1W84_33890 [Burkholderia pseudomallei]|nr:hypothetical protein [Burkholderia pseudomallei]NAX49444.1 hypothetical protein [Burkholderia pseudomallei]NAX62273.1 hypothetical protein [Burkholderia pseudomallei]NAX78629.1 hypothetical protein [Burkholderia pseudomallei]NAX85126.1 hypothetical protein [Burkholderia pseudomallei]
MAWRTAASLRFVLRRFGLLGSPATGERVSRASNMKRAPNGAPDC